jgi:hypothetical protein
MIAWFLIVTNFYGYYKCRGGNIKSIKFNLIILKTEYIIIEHQKKFKSLQDNLTKKGTNFIT